MWTKTESVLPKMVGTEAEPGQVDEYYFAGCRKYNRARLRSGDRRSPGEGEAPAEMQIEMDSWGAAAPSDDEGNEFVGRPSRRSN